MPLHSWAVMGCMEAQVNRREHNHEYQFGPRNIDLVVMRRLVLTDLSLLGFPNHHKSAETMSSSALRRRGGARRSEAVGFSGTRARVLDEADPSSGAAEVRLLILLMFGESNVVLGSGNGRTGCWK
jgi:hypothetical protein